MLKGLILLFHAPALFLQGVLPTNVNISQTAPASAQTNTSFIVQININKATAEGSGKFTERLPVGFSAVPIDREGAKVNFDNNAIQFSWDTLPSDGSSLNISFRVDVSTLASATRDTLLGKFTYTWNNQNFEAACPPSYITITGSSSAVGAISATQSSGNSAPVAATAAPAPQPSNNNMATSGPGGIFVERQFPSAFMEPMSTAKITLIIHKGNITGFAKVEDSIPTGFIANSMDTYGASFTFEDNIAKFVWQNLPADSVIKVSYQLSSGTDIRGKYILHGDLSYIYNNTPVTSSTGITPFTTPGDNIASTNITPSSTSTGTSAAAPPPTPAVNTPNNTSVSSTVDNTNQSAASSNFNNSPATSQPISASDASIQSNIVYRVQILALHNTSGVLSNLKRKISNPISTEINGGYTKYTVGNYKEYKSARQEMDDLINKGFPGSFIVAYNSGVRIATPDALALSHQQK